MTIAPRLAADHIYKPNHKLSSHRIINLNDLLDRCEKGNGKPCDLYGRRLAERNRPGDRRRAIFYVRRACQLAYMPACLKVSPRERARMKQPKSVPLPHN